MTINALKPWTDCLFSAGSTAGIHRDALCLQSHCLISCRRKASLHSQPRLPPSSSQVCQDYPCRTSQSSPCPLLPALGWIRPMGPHSILSSSAASRGAWMSKSLRTRWLQPLCRPRKPHVSSGCPASQIVLSGVFPIAQHPPGDGRRGLNAVNPHALPP